MSRLRRYPRGTTRPVQQRRIGNDVTRVGAIGLGAMPLSTKEDRPSRRGGGRGARRAGRRGDPDRHRRRLRPRRGGVRAQRGAGGPRAAVVRRRPDVLVATKGGHTRRGTDWELDGSPAYLRRACEASLRRLGVDAIGLYQFHRPDPATPWEESMGALRALADDGLVRMVGISNADIAQIDVARSIVRRCAGERAEPVLARLALLGRRAGALRAATGWRSCRGARSAGCRPPARWTRRRPRSPRWPPSSGVSVYRVTLAWHLAQADVVVPIPAPPGRSRSRTPPPPPTWSSVRSSWPG